MTAVVLDKTWVVNRFYYPLITDGTINTKTLLIDIKNTMKLNGWSVASSSDSTLPGTGVGDNWTDYTDIVNGVGDHSWIVLTNSNISPTFSVCWDFSNVSYLSASFYCTTGGYNLDGTKSSKPTAIGTEVVLRNNAVWTAFVSSTSSNVLVFSSSDGECTRVYWGYDTTYTSSSLMWLFDKPKNPPSWFTDPYIAYMGVTWPGYSFCSSSLSDPFKTNYGATTVNLALGSIGLNQPLGQIVGHLSQDYGGSFIFSPAYLCSITSSCPGIYGELYDLYWCSKSFGIGSALTEIAMKSAIVLPSSAGANGFINIIDFFQGGDGNPHYLM